MSEQQHPQHEYDGSQIQVLEGLEACLLYTSRCV